MLLFVTLNMTLQAEVQVSLIVISFTVLLHPNV